MKKILILMLCGSLLIGMNSCGLMEWAVLSSPGASNQTRGTVIGAASGARAGAVIGSITSRGSGNDNTLIGTAVGAVAGGIIGNVLGKNIDKQYEQARPDERQEMNSTSHDDYGYNYGYNHRSDDALYFKSGKTKLSRKAKRTLDEVARQLCNDPATNAEIYGHTDNSSNYNRRRRLSLERAIEVKNYLRHKGVPAAQLYAQGCADLYPVASNDTDDGRKRNRRVEIVLTRGNDNSAIVPDWSNE